MSPKWYKPIIPILLSALLLIACSRQPNKSSTSDKSIAQPSQRLEEDTVTITLEYFGWACPCAQWITPGNRKKYDLYSEHDPQKFYDEGPNAFHYVWPKDDEVNEKFGGLFQELLDSQSILKLKFTGQFYTEPQYSGDEGEAGPARTLLFCDVSKAE